jgi:hypothetical protein
MFQGLQTFAQGIKVRIGRKYKSALPGAKAVNSRKNVVQMGGGIFKWLEWLFLEWLFKDAGVDF